MARLFLTPSRIVSGQGALDDSLDILRGLGTKAFVVTDPMMVKLGNCKTVTDALERAGLGFEVFDQITGEPSDVMIEAGIAAFKASGCDMYVGLGGGSPIDAMKAIAMMAACDGDIDEQMGVALDFDRPPLVAIPTTAVRKPRSSRSSTTRARASRCSLRVPRFCPTLPLWTRSSHARRRRASRQTRALTLCATRSNRLRPRRCSP